MNKRLSGIGLLLLLLGLFSSCEEPSESVNNELAEVEWQAVLDSLSRELEMTADPVEQTTILRNFAGALLDVGFVPDSLNQEYRSMSLTDANVVYWYDLFQSVAVPTQCDEISKFYVYLLDYFGFKAVNYSYGLKGTPFTHTITAIDIGTADRAYIILQDPTLATLYLDTAEQAIHLPDLWEELYTAHPEHINWISDTIATRAIVLPEVKEELLAYLNAIEGCEEMLQNYELNNMGSQAINLPFQRHYFSWKDYCDRFDQRFLSALVDAGYAGDQLSALIVHPEVWGGDEALIQYFQAIIDQNEIKWAKNKGKTKGETIRDE